MAPDLAQRDPQVGVGCGVVDSQIWVPRKGSQSEGASHVRSPPYAPSPLTPPELPWSAPVAAVPRSPPVPVAWGIVYRKCAVVGAGRAAGRQDRPSGGDPMTPRSPGSHRPPLRAPAPPATGSRSCDAGAGHPWAPAEALTDHQAPYVPPGLPPSHSASAGVVATALTGYPRRPPRSRARSMPPATMPGPPARPAEALTDHQAPYCSP